MRFKVTFRAKRGDYKAAEQISIDEICERTIVTVEKASLVIPATNDDALVSVVSEFRQRYAETLRSKVPLEMIEILLEAMREAEPSPDDGANLP